MAKSKKNVYAVGDKWFRLTLVRKTEEKEHSSFLWEALCDCGNTTTVIPYNLITGHKRSCGCMFIESTRETGKLNAVKNRKYDPVVTSARRVWVCSNYKDCDFETFFKLTKMPCHYCGILPHRIYNASTTGKDRYTDGYQLEHGNFTYNGLDRVDSSLGHHAENVVPCCFDCNKAKSALTVDQFLELITRIYKHSITQSSLRSCPFQEADA